VISNYGGELTGAAHAAAHQAAAHQAAAHQAAAHQAAAHQAAAEQAAAQRSAAQHVQPQVERGTRMGEGADGDEIDARLRDRPGLLQP
jgi:hypothetical protein